MEREGMEPFLQAMIPRLREGGLYIEVEPRGGGFSVETPAGSAQVLGTRFYIASRAKKGTAMTAARAKFFTTVLVLAGAVQMANPFGRVSGSRGGSLYADEESAPRRGAEDLQARFEKYYEPVEVKAKPKIPAYALPLSPDRIANFQDAAPRLGLAKDEPLLLKNGFVVVPLPPLRDEDGSEIPFDDIVKPYEGIKMGGVPVFVTADTLLHLFHVQFDESLKDVEEREFVGDLTGIAEMLEKRLAEEFSSFHIPVPPARRAGTEPHEAIPVTPRPEVVQTHRDALRKAWTFAAIGLKCLRPDFEPSPKITEDVAVVIEKMEKHEGPWGSKKEWPLFRYAEDFSQYVPRGHYTRSEPLKRYFKAMMWFGRMAFILKGGDPHGAGDEAYLVSAEEARLQTSAAVRLTRLLDEGKLPDGRSAREVWERIYAVTAFYVGLADDLGLSEYRDALAAVRGGGPDGPFLGAVEDFQKLQVELAKRKGPAIYGGTGWQFTERGANPEKLLQALDKAAGWRLMGQRFIPDSYMMGRLVFPTVGETGNANKFTAVPTGGGIIRGFPRGLDVMALLGSHRARELLSDLGDDAYGTEDAGGNLKYSVVFDALRKEFDALSPSDWNRNLYWSWLHCLKPLLTDFGEGYPTFMTTQAWREKSLTTALASWAQLRHDTILYAKQSYTMGVVGVRRGPKPVEGCVEPVPEFYARLLALTRMMRKGLVGMKVLSPPAVDRLEKLDAILVRLLNISERELAHEELTEEDYAFIRDFGEALEGLEVKNPELDKAIEAAERAGNWREAGQLEDSKKKAMQTTLIADVHTDQNSEQALEEGTGRVDLGVFCYLQPDGRLVLGAGPVLSYYEFKHPMEDRLTDEKWREMLDSGRAPARPEWTKSFRRGSDAPKPASPGPDNP